MTSFHERQYQKKKLILAGLQHLGTLDLALLTVIALFFGFVNEKKLELALGIAPYLLLGTVFLLLLSLLFSALAYVSLMIGFEHVNEKSAKNITVHVAVAFVSFLFAVAGFTMFIEFLIIEL